MHRRTRINGTMTALHVVTLISLLAAPALALVTEQSIYRQAAQDCIAQMHHTFPPVVWYMAYDPVRNLEGGPTADQILQDCIRLKNEYGFRVFQVNTRPTNPILEDPNKLQTCDSEGIKFVLFYPYVIVGTLNHPIDSNTTRMQFNADEGSVAAAYPCNVYSLEPNERGCITILDGDNTEDVCYRLADGSGNFVLDANNGLTWDTENAWGKNNDWCPFSIHVDRNNPDPNWHIKFSHPAGTVVVRWRGLDEFLEAVDASGQMSCIAAFQPMDDAYVGWKAYPPDANDPNNMICLDPNYVRAALRDHLDAHGLDVPVIWSGSFNLDTCADADWEKDIIYTTPYPVHPGYLSGRQMRDVRDYCATHDVNDLLLLQLTNWALGLEPEPPVVYDYPTDMDVYQQVIMNGPRSDLTWAPHSISFLAGHNLLGQPHYPGSDANTPGSMAEAVRYLMQAVPVINRAPRANAGIDKTVAVGNTVDLTGMSNDDGLPNPPAATTCTWGKISGPGSVTFADAAAFSTTATFSQTGTYMLNLTVSDSEFTGQDHCKIIVNSGPTVDAGSDQSIVADPNTAFTASLSGTVSDDGVPAALTHTWSQISGPGTVTFTDANALETTATFSTAGTYVLRLTASDSAQSAYDECAIFMYRGAYISSAPTYRTANCFHDANVHLVVSDDMPDANKVRVRLDANAQVTWIQLSTRSGLTFYGDSNNALEFSGTLQDVNAALTNVVVRTTVDAHLVVRVHDGVGESAWQDMRDIMIYR
jgi:hypothetical protein